MTAILLSENRPFWPNYCFMHPESQATDEIVDELWEFRENPEYEALLLECLLMLHFSSGSHHEVLAQFERVTDLAGFMLPTLVRYAESLRGSNAKKTGLCVFLSKLIQRTVEKLPDQALTILRGIASAKLYPSRKFRYLTSLLGSVAREHRLDLYASAINCLRQSDPQVSLDLAYWASTEGEIRFDW